MPLPFDLETAKTHLKSTDPIMGGLIDSVGEVNFEPGGDLFEALVSSIISQVISTAAADTVSRRLRTHTDNLVTPEILAQIDQETYRSFGIGAQKYRYIHSLAHEFLHRPEHFHGLDALSDAEVLKKLTALKGIGTWTAQMVLMFNLARVDVFAPDDLALRNTTIKLYGLSETISKKDLENHALRWAPYRTIASVYIWNSIKKWS